MDRFYICINLYMVNAVVRCGDVHTSCQSVFYNDSIMQWLITNYYISTRNTSIFLNPLLSYNLNHFR